MKNYLLAAALLGAVAGPASAANVGVSISVGQPGFYGRIDLGGVPRPQVIYEQPVVYQPAPVAVVRQPIYLRVPTGHEKNWGRYCGRYNACNQPVYFVRDNWYRDVYAPHYRSRPLVRPPVAHHRPDPRRDDHRDGRGHDRGNDRDDHRGNGRGPGDRGNGHGPDRDHRRD